MESKWSKVKFGDILAIPLRNGLTKPKSVRGTGCKLINMGELFANSRISTRITMDLAPVTSKEYENAHVRQGDLLFARQSLVLSGAGKCSIVSDDAENAVFESHLIRARLNQSIALGEFYYYYFLSFAGRKNIESIVEQVAAAGIRGSDLAKLDVPLPPLPEQRSIAAMLSCLDNKIEMNNKIKINLETQAQAIFKNWFVDFEPFREGEFVESDLGPIPKNWRVHPLTDIAQYLNGLAMQKFRPFDDERGIPVLKIRELRQGNYDVSSELCSESIKSEYIINNGDVVFSWSGSLLVDIWCGGKCGLNQHLFKVTSSNYAKWFYYFWTKHYLNEFAAIAAGKATTMGHIKRSDLEKSLVAVPDEQVYKEATALLSPMIEQIISNRVQSRTLVALRDTLLPRLMSGEIEVPIGG